MTAADYTALFNEYFPRMCYYADSFVNDREASKDITVQVFCTVWEKQIVSECMKGWLYISVRNACFNYLKTKKRLQVREADYFNAYEDIHPCIEAEVIKVEVIADVYAAGGRLPDKYKAVFDLVIKGLSIPQIAVKLGISENLVSQQKHRAIEMIRRGVGR